MKSEHSIPSELSHLRVGKINLVLFSASGTVIASRFSKLGNTSSNFTFLLSHITLARTLMLTRIHVVFGDGLWQSNLHDPFPVRRFSQLNSNTSSSSTSVSSPSSLDSPEAMERSRACRNTGRRQSFRMGILTRVVTPAKGVRYLGTCNLFSWVLRVALNEGDLLCFVFRSAKSACRLLGTLSLMRDKEAPHVRPVRCTKSLPTSMFIASTFMQFTSFIWNTIESLRHESFG